MKKATKMFSTGEDIGNANQAEVFGYDIFTYQFDSKITGWAMYDINYSIFTFSD